MKTEFMSWNTSLYIQGNKLEGKVEPIDWTLTNSVFNTIGEFIDKQNGIAVLQEIPYKINCAYDNGEAVIDKWNYHPIFEAFIKRFSHDKYDILYDDSVKYRIIQTVILAKKDRISLWPNAKNTNSNYYFMADGMICLGVHSNNAFELRDFIAQNTIRPHMIAGDFNSGNYLLADSKADYRMHINRENFLLLSEGYMDLFQGQRTTNYKNCKEQRQIDHVLLENSERIYNKYKCTSTYVDKNITYSDHYPLKWTIEEK